MPSAIEQTKILWQILLRTVGVYRVVVISERSRTRIDLVQAFNEPCASPIGLIYHWSTWRPSFVTPVFHFQVLAILVSSTSTSDSLITIQSQSSILGYDPNPIITGRPYLIILYRRHSHRRIDFSCTRQPHNVNPSTNLPARIPPSICLPQLIIAPFMDLMVGIDTS